MQDNFCNASSTSVNDEIHIMNEVASSIKAYATNKGFIKEIDNVVTGVAKCMNDLGVIDILDDSILNEAYKCVDELC